MTIPQSLLVVALAVGWLVVLVPWSSRRRGHVQQVVDGSGFRVMDRTKVKRRGLIRRGRAGAGRDSDSSDDLGSDDLGSDDLGSDDLGSGDLGSGDLGSGDLGSTVFSDSEGEMSSQHNDVDGQVDGAREDGPQRDDTRDDDTEVIAAVTDDVRVTAVQLELVPDHVSDDSDASASADSDDQALRAEYQAWREATRDPEPAETAADGSSDGVAETSAGRTIPRRHGRGSFDPEAAERARAYHFARRRRSLLVLLLVTAAFTVTAFTVSSQLWIGAAASAVMLMLFLVYLRRQVKVENDIRDRRMAKLERARQIRPERSMNSQGAAFVVDPYAQRASRTNQVPGPVRHRVGRVVVDLDDDDPAFDDLEHYEPMVYRRAVGQ